MGIAQDHLVARPAPYLLQFVQGDAALNGPRCPSVLEIVPTKGRKPSLSNGFLERRSVAVFDRLSTVGEDMLGIAGRGLAIQSLGVPQMIGLLHCLGVAKAP